MGYVHSGAIDQPLSATHLAYTDWQRTGSTYTKMEWQPFTRIPLWNWRGYNELTLWADSGANNDGNYRYCTTPQATRCLNNVFTPNNTSFGAMHYLQDSVPSHRFPFYGTLVDEKEDGVGTYYRRNRYLDPQTGRFTQEDPIGIAGGLNLYGFASGDPVNFNDPFGLAPMAANGVEDPNKPPPPPPLRHPKALKDVEIGGGYSVKYDPGRAGGLGPHYQVYKRGARLPGIIDPETGERLAHAGQQADIPNRVINRLYSNGWINLPGSPEAAAARAARAAIAGAPSRAPGRPRSPGGRVLGGVVGAILGTIFAPPLY